MNLAPVAPALVLGLVCAFLMAGAVEDAVRLRISNFTSGGVLVSAIIAAAMAGFSTSLWQNGLVFLFLLAAGTMVFAAGQMGGGDVKLLAAAGAWFNIESAIWLLVAVFLCGGVLALVYIAVRLARGRGLKRRTQGGGIPYGVAIVSGTLILFGTQLRFV